MEKLPSVPEIKTTVRGPLPDLDAYGLKPSLPEVLDATMIRSFATCPNQFYLRHVLGLRPRAREPQPALDWGSAWHNMMYAFHANEDLDEALMVWDELPDDWGADDKKLRNKGRLRELFLKYLKKHLSLDRAEWEVLRREQYFDIYCPPDGDCPFGGCDLRWCGRIDQIRRDRDSGKVYIWDYKTTSWLRGSYMDEQKHGFQIPGYVWAGHHIMPTSIKGAYIDLLHATKTKHNFIRNEIPLINQWILEWRENVRTLISHIQTLWENHPRNPAAWTKNWEECEKYRGCPFRPVHYTADPDGRTRLRILSDDYMEDQWDPSDLL